jgi:aryl-alcohol dehydrogenase-like predicted oxidoreductase
MASHASSAGVFKIGGDLPINRLGFGAMRITGKGIWGAPDDIDGALRTLQRLPDLGVNFIDTADSYGPDVSEQLIREAFKSSTRGKGEMVIATKAGLARTGPDQWTPLGRPEYLIQQTYRSLEKLGVEQIDLWQLHRIDPKVPRAEQFGTVRYLLDQGLIRHAGLSEVSVRDIEEASKYFHVATVQNRYNLTDRDSEDVLDYATRHNIGFIPWYPLGAGSLADPHSQLSNIAKKHDATHGQIALAWLLQRSTVIIPIPGTSKVDHLDENVAATDIKLDPAELDILNGFKR